MMRLGWSTQHPTLHHPPPPIRTKPKPIRRTSILVVVVVVVVVVLLSRYQHNYLVPFDPTPMYWVSPKRNDTRHFIRYSSFPGNAGSVRYQPVRTRRTGHASNRCLSAPPRTLLHHHHPSQQQQHWTHPGTITNNNNKTRRRQPKRNNYCPRKNSKSHNINGSSVTRYSITTTIMDHDDDCYRNYDMIFDRVYYNTYDIPFDI